MTERLIRKGSVSQKFYDCIYFLKIAATAATLVNKVGRRSPYRDAVRILAILVRGSQAGSNLDVTNAVRVFRGEMRLMAFEFWVRNPDYLAEELIDLFESTRDYKYLREAEEIFASEEPDVRRFPMIRYHFGAYERLDDALAILRSRELVVIKQTKHHGQVRETDFFVTQAAVTVLSQIQTSAPDLDWYVRRASLVAEVAGNRGGDALKTRQYQQWEYAQTRLGDTIPTIADRVRERLFCLRQAG